MGTLSVATYNIQRGRGIDLARRFERTARVVEALEADVIGLQEVVREPWGPRGDQPGELGRRAHAEAIFLPARPHGSGAFGCALLTRLPVEEVTAIDLSVSGREPRKALCARLRAGASRVHVVVCHLGLGPNERRSQVTMLRAHLRRLDGTRVVMGDFNEPRRGAVTRALDAELGPAPIVVTHPAPLPLLPLDRVWCDAGVRELFAHRAPPARVASDHLPLVARVALH